MAGVAMMVRDKYAVRLAQEQREDEAQFGQYRTGDLILAYMNALASRDAESVIDL